MRNSPERIIVKKNKATFQTQERQDAKNELALEQYRMINQTNRNKSNDQLDRYGSPYQVLVTPVDIVTCEHYKMKGSVQRRHILKPSIDFKNKILQDKR